MTIDVAQLTIKPGVESGFFVERILLYLGEFVSSLEGGLRRVALLHYFLSPPSFPPQGETCIANSPYRQCYTTFRFVLFFCLDTKEPKSQGCTSVCLRTTLHSTACTPTRKRHYDSSLCEESMAELKQGFGYLPFRLFSTRRT